MKYALVTGGSRGIGRAICVQLARDGYSVIINYKSNHEAANETKRLIESEGGRAELLPFDVANPDAINTALSQWEQAHKDEYIEVMIHNAGISRDDMFLDIDSEDWHHVIDTGLNAFYYINQRLLPEMILHRGGRIVVISSIAALRGYNGRVNHSAVKAALIGATKALAVEVAPKNITINAIAPGLIMTDIHRDYLRLQQKTEEEAMESYKAFIPMQRIGNPEEVANVASFLVSEKASYVTGQVISVDGGLAV